MGKVLQITGITGSVLTVFGLVAYLFPPREMDNLYVQIHLGLGLLLILIFLFTRGATLLGSLRQQSTLYGLHALSYTIIFFSILILVNFLNIRHYLRWDLTEAKVFSLSPQSIKVLRGLKKDLEIYAFFEMGENRSTSDLLQSYIYQSSKIKFWVIDPDQHPDMVKRFKIEQPNTLHLRYGKDSTNLLETTEKTVTNAIIKLTRMGKKRVYFLTGHGEPGITDGDKEQGYALAKEALENDNYQVSELLLSTLKDVPKDASLLIIAGPQNPLLENETEAIEKYANQGGKLFILYPPPDTFLLEEFLRDWGVDVGNNVVVDQVIRLFSGPQLGIQPIVNTYSADHPITRGFRERSIFPMVRSVDAIKPHKKRVEVTSLVMTSPTSWAETEVQRIFEEGKAAIGDGDRKGPISVGVAVTADLKKKGEAKIVVLGSSTFANNKFIRVFFNRDLLLNISNWLVGEDEFITIGPRSIRSSRIDLTAREGSTIFYLSFLVLPEILLVMGLAVWWKRR